MRLSLAFAAIAASFVAVSSASADVTIGQFNGGVAEAGWGRVNGGVQPLDSSVYPVTDLGNGGALETNIAGFSDSFAYSFSTAGTKAAFLANDALSFDVIYRGTPTDPNSGGFSQIYQVLFQRNDPNGGFPLTTYTTTASGATLSSFGNGGSSDGWAAGSSNVQTVANITIDYRSFKSAFPAGFDPSTLQFWMSTNDSNRVFKAIDNVRLVQLPEPTTLCGLAVVGTLIRRRRAR